MARVAPAPVDRYAPLFGADAPVRVQIYAHRPELAKAFLAFGDVLRTERILPDRLIELVRLRVAYHNQCRSCMATRYEEALEDGVTEELVCELERPEEAPDLSEAERAAIHYADLMATNHHAITDATFARLREHFDEAEIVELAFHVGWFVGYGRMAAVFRVLDGLPERFRAPEGEVVTPWGGGGIVRVGGRSARGLSRA
jgi:AhpD family alkylhydroperoxidase